MQGTLFMNSRMEELGMSTMTGNPTYNLTAILQNHHSVMLTFGISVPEEDIDLPKLYWIPKLHKNPYKKRYIAGSAVLNQASFSDSNTNPNRS